MTAVTMNNLFSVLAHQSAQIMHFYIQLHDKLKEQEFAAIITRETNLEFDHPLLQECIFPLRSYKISKVSK